jgi:hypothetical protein
MAALCGITKLRVACEPWPSTDVHNTSLVGENAEIGKSAKILDLDYKSFDSPAPLTLNRSSNTTLVSPTIAVLKPIHHSKKLQSPSAMAALSTLRFGDMPPVFTSSTPSLLVQHQIFPTPSVRIIDLPSLLIDIPEDILTPPSTKHAQGLASPSVEDAEGRTTLPSERSSLRHRPHRHGSFSAPVPKAIPATTLSLEKSICFFGHVASVPANITLHICSQKFIAPRAKWVYEPNRTAAIMPSPLRNSIAPEEVQEKICGSKKKAKGLAYSMALPEYGVRLAENVALLKERAKVDVNPRGRMGFSC